MISFKVTFPDHPSSPPIFSGVRVARYSVFRVVFCRSMLSFYPFSFSHFVVCPSIYVIWLPPFGIFKLFLSFYSFSFGHCVVCPFSIYASDYPLWYLQTLLILLSVFFWPLCGVSFIDLRLLITPLWYLQTPLILLSVFFWPVCGLSVIELRLLMTAFGIFKLFLSFYPFSFGHCVVCPSSIYGSWLPPLVSSNSRPLYFLSFIVLRLLITSLWYFLTLDHCVACPMIYGSWLPFGIF